LPEYSHDELVQKWEEFFDEFAYEGRIFRIADSYPDQRSLAVPYEDLNRFDTDFGVYVLGRPQNALVAGEEAIRRIVPATEESLDIHLRIRGLPKDRRIAIRHLRSEHLGTFLAVEGLVRKATEVRPKVVDAHFRCVRCGTVVKQPQEGTTFREPLECDQDQGGCGRASSATKFLLLDEASRFLDTQKIEIQEAPEGMRGGEEPQRLTAFVADDLTGQISPGDRIILNGVLRSVQRGRAGARSTLFDIFVDVNSIEVEQVEYEEIEITEEDIKQIEEVAKDPDIFVRVIASIAPSIYGMHTEKEALALQLFGGVPKNMPDERRIRGDIHILLVGDPGTAKSELLSYMTRLSPRSIYATGRSASAAGLTAAAVRDEFGEGRWTLEAGALVLADKGLACIDEIDKMNPQDRSSIHEAMEQQRVSVAKAGITAVLQARCAVLAAANPKFGRFDETKYISEQIDLPPTLLSRFDIIFSIIDRPESGKDRLLAEHVLRGHYVGELLRRRQAGEEVDVPSASLLPYQPHFEPAFLRKYVAYAKRIYPIMTPDAMDVIRQKYLEIRKQGEAAGSSVPITPRQLEAFVRLAEASARGRLSPLVDAQDADRAVRVVEYWLSRVAGEEGRFDIDIIATGVSHSQREQIYLLREVIVELERESGVADKEEVLRRAQERGIPPTRTEALLKRLSEEGELYSPSKDKYRLAARL
jgi:replicative DNA helicase Mcm